MYFAALVVKSAPRDSGAFFFAALGKTLKRSLLIVKFLKDAIELRDLEDFFNLRGEAHDFHLAPLLDHARIAVDELAHTRTVKIKQPMNIQDDFLPPLAH